MKPPLGYHLPQPHLVCKLRKSLYGLHQAHNNGIPSWLLLYVILGFHNVLLIISIIDEKGDVLLALLIYVNDLLLTGNDS